MGIDRHAWTIEGDTLHCPVSVGPLAATKQACGCYQFVGRATSDFDCLELSTLAVSQEWNGEQCRCACH